MSNKIHITGRLGRDSEMRYQTSGDAVLNFAVADDVGYGEKKKTQWFECSIWGKRAETLAQYLTKGQQVVVHGSMELTSYTSKDGIEKAKLVCRVSDIDLVGGKPGAGEQNDVPQHAPASPQVQARPPLAPPSNTPQPQSAGLEEDDIPF